jgi:hypothetical protein
MRRRGDADEVVFTCSACPLSLRKGSLPAGDEASHAKGIGLSHGFLEKSSPVLCVVSLTSLYIGDPQFGPRLERGRTVAKAYACSHCSLQVCHGEVGFATALGCDPQGTMHRAKTDNRQ